MAGTTEWKSEAVRAYQRRTMAVDAVMERTRGGCVGKDTANRVWRKVKGAATLGLISLFTPVRGGAGTRASAKNSARVRQFGNFSSSLSDSLGGAGSRILG